MKNAQLTPRAPSGAHSAHAQAMGRRSLLVLRPWGAAACEMIAAFSLIWRGSPQVSPAAALGITGSTGIAPANRYRPASRRYHMSSWVQSLAR